MTSTMGLTKDDRKMRDFIEKWKPKKAPEMLRQMEKNMKDKVFLARRKNIIECHLCAKPSEVTHPIYPEMCSKCVKKVAKRYGNVGIISYRHVIRKEICDSCTMPRITIYKLVTRACTKCLEKVVKGEKEAREEEHGRTRISNARRKEGIAS